MNSNTSITEDAFILDGQVFTFCGGDKWQNTKFTCNDRVKYVMTQQLVTRRAAIIDLFRKKECVCASINAGLKGNNESLFNHHGHTLQNVNGVGSFLLFIMALAVTILFFGRHGRLKLISYFYVLVILHGSMMLHEDVSFEQRNKPNRVPGQLENFVKSSPQVGRGGGRVQFKPFQLAPWDAADAKGGNALILNACQAEISQSGCLNRLPLYDCLQRYNSSTSWLSTKCKTVMSPCSAEKGDYKNKCRSIFHAFYRPIFSQEDVARLETLIFKIHEAFSEQGVQYWMAAGSAIGSLYHHGRIPWDDDVDMYVEEDDILRAVKGMKNHGLGVRLNRGCNRKCIRLFKIYLPELDSISNKSTHSFPFVDLFPIYCNNTHCAEKNEWAEGNEIAYLKDWIFPLKQRPFGRMSLPFPNKLLETIEDRYGQHAKDRCIRAAYNHKTEVWLGHSQHFDVQCKDLPLPPAMVVSTNSSPWESDLPYISVEHLMDNNTRLSTVTYWDGNEIRRSYADGLTNTNNQISVDTSSDLSHAILVPFLLEERDSYACNVAKRSAKDLNLEVMSMLDTPEISNNFFSRDLISGTLSSLRIGEWNAERGTNWHVFDKFFPDADIIILNELDWGMARSGNVHTVRLMADALGMNYAYGVEFMELTNGNAKEINATVGITNVAGYHGNAVLSKWSISDVKIIRLHPLYDLLYEPKAKGMAAGERRLGGRMALFASTHIGNVEILLVSVHSHAGSKKHLLKDDAKAICKEIERRNTTNVILGGDTGPPLTTTLVSECGFHPLEKTNKRRGTKFQPTWRVDCPNGEAPIAKFQRGDWLLLRGAAFPCKEERTTLSVFYPYVMDGEKYNCISDHAMIAIETDFVLSSN